MDVIACTSEQKSNTRTEKDVINGCLPNSQKTVIEGTNKGTTVARCFVAAKNLLYWLGVIFFHIILHVKRMQRKIISCYV